MGIRHGNGGGSRWVPALALGVLGIAALFVLLPTGGNQSVVRVGGGSAPPLTIAPAVQVGSVVASWLDRTASPEDVASPAQRSGLVEDFVASTARSRVGDELTRTADAFDTADAAGLELRSVPLAYRIRSLTDDRAVVETRQLILQASPGTTTAGQLATGRIVLTHEGRWRVAGASVRATPLSAVTHDDLGDLDRLRGFRHVP